MIDVMQDTEVKLTESDSTKLSLQFFFDDDGKVSQVGSTLHASNAAYGFPFGS